MTRSDVPISWSGLGEKGKIEREQRAEEGENDLEVLGQVRRPHRPRKEEQRAESNSANVPREQESNSAKAGGGGWKRVSVGSRGGEERIEWGGAGRLGITRKGVIPRQSESGSLSGPSRATSAAQPRRPHPRRASASASRRAAFPFPVWTTFAARPGAAAPQVCFQPDPPLCLHRPQYSNHSGAKASSTPRHASKDWRIGSPGR